MPPVNLSPAVSLHRNHPRASHSAILTLLSCYDYPDPRSPGRVIRGYDRAHALRTARMCVAVAQRLGYSPLRIEQFRVACLLHDLGRAGLDRPLFGKIWSWARQHGIPTRPREWRAVHPTTRYGRETEAFFRLHGTALQREGIAVDEWTRAQVEMRLGYARRFRRRLEEVRPILARAQVRWHAWMTRVVLYYYYPEKLAAAPQWMKQLGEVLVACEQFEAYSNRRRGADYYARSQESLEEAFAYLHKLEVENILSRPVVGAFAALAREGAFDAILVAARRAPLSRRDIQYLRTLSETAAVCR